MRNDWIIWEEKEDKFEEDMTEVCKIMSAIEKKHRGQYYLSFPVELGAITWIPPEADSKPKNIIFFIQQVAAMPMDVWTRTLQDFLGRLVCRWSKKQTTKCSGKHWSVKGERWFVKIGFTSTKNYPKRPRIISTSPPANRESCWSCIMFLKTNKQTKAA